MRQQQQRPNGALVRAQRRPRRGPLSSLPENLQRVLRGHRSAVKMRPGVKVNPNHITCTYHCHRGPAWRINANSKRRWLVRHVPCGCVAPQGTDEENVGCDWSVTLRYPDRHVPDVCPVTGEPLTGKWRDQIPFAAAPPVNDDTADEAPLMVTCRIHNKHIGHDVWSVCDDIKDLFGQVAVRLCIVLSLPCRVLALSCAFSHLFIYH